MSPAPRSLPSDTFRSAAAVLGDEEILGHYLGVSEWTVIAWIRGAGTPSQAALLRAENLVAQSMRRERLRPVRARAMAFLEDAVCAAGGRQALARAMDVDMPALILWLSGREQPGDEALHRALDLVERIEGTPPAAVH